MDFYKEYPELVGFDYIYLKTAHMTTLRGFLVSRKRFEQIRKDIPPHPVLEYPELADMGVINIVLPDGPSLDSFPDIPDDLVIPNMRQVQEERW